MALENSREINEKRLLRTIREEEEELIVAGLMTHVPVMNEERLQRVCDHPDLHDDAQKAMQGDHEAIRTFLKVVESLVRKQVTELWLSRIRSRHLAHRIGLGLKDGIVPEGWTYQGGGCWKLPEKDE